MPTGVRNPYRFSFDSGRHASAHRRRRSARINIEEVDKVTKGANLGWHYKEGTFAFDPTKRPRHQRVFFQRIIDAIQSALLSIPKK